MRPVLPRNQRKPMKRIKDSTAVAYKRNLKKLAVRLEAVPCYKQLVIVKLGKEADQEMLLTTKPD
jgi:hypothetical protein